MTERRVNAVFCDSSGQLIGGFCRYKGTQILLANVSNFFPFLGKNPLTNSPPSPFTKTSALNRKEIRSDVRLRLMNCWMNGPPSALTIDFPFTVRYRTVSGVVVRAIKRLRFHVLADPARETFQIAVEKEETQ
jgi:hypothetical protein